LSAAGRVDVERSNWVAFGGGRAVLSRANAPPSGLPSGLSPRLLDSSLCGLIMCLAAFVFP